MIPIGFPWVPKHSYEVLQIPMDSYKIPKDSYVFPWYPLTSNELVQVSKAGAGALVSAEKACQLRTRNQASKIQVQTSKIQVRTPKIEVLDIPSKYKSM